MGLMGGWGGYACGVCGGQLCNAVLNCVSPYSNSLLPFPSFLLSAPSPSPTGSYERRADVVSPRQPQAPRRGQEAPGARVRPKVRPRPEKRQRAQVSRRYPESAARRTSGAERCRRCQRRWRWGRGRQGGGYGGGGGCGGFDPTSGRRLAEGTGRDEGGAGCGKVARQVAAARRGTDRTRCCRRTTAK